MRIAIVLKKPFKKTLTIMAIASVTRAIEKYTSEYVPLLYMEDCMATGARLRPMTMITEPITTGGKALSSQRVPATFTSAATRA